MERTLRYGLLLAPVAALLVALGTLYWMPRAAPMGESPLSSAETGARGLFSPVKAGSPVELEVMDVIPIEEADTHAVLLVSKDQAILLPLFVTEEAAVSIAFRLAERHSPHPLSADLMDTMVDKMGGKVTRIEIDDVQDDVYTSQITIEQGDKQLQLDARPSDAIAMALTGKARIFAAPKVLSEAGIRRDELESLREGGGLERDFGVGGSGDEGGPESAPWPDAPPPDEEPGLLMPPGTDKQNIRL